MGTKSMKQILLIEDETGISQTIRVQLQLQPLSLQRLLALPFLFPWLFSPALFSLANRLGAGIDSIVQWVRAVEEAVNRTLVAQQVNIHLIMFAGKEHGASLCCCIKYIVGNKTCVGKEVNGQQVAAAKRALG